LEASTATEMGLAEMALAKSLQVFMSTNPEILKLPEFFLQGPVTPLYGYSF